MIIPQLKTYFHKITGWIMCQPRKCLLSSYGQVFYYVAAAHRFGKMSVAYEPVTGRIEAVIFYWVDNLETMEAKAEAKAQQFEFSPTHKGNLLFIGECIGRREAIARLYKAGIQKYPHLMAVPFYTFRRGKLVKLSDKIIHRYTHGKEVA